MPNETMNNNMNVNHFEAIMIPAWLHLKKSWSGPEVR